MSSIHVDFDLFSKAPLYELAYDARRVLSLFKVKKFQNTSKAMFNGTTVPVTKQNESKINLLSLITNHLYNLLDKDELMSLYFRSILITHFHKQPCAHRVWTKLLLSSRSRQDTLRSIKQNTIKYSTGTQPFQYLRVWVEAIARLPIGTIPTVFCGKGVNNWGEPWPDISQDVKTMSDILKKPAAQPNVFNHFFCFPQNKKLDKTNQPIKESRNG